MKVRVAYTVDASDDYRRAINLYYGRPGLATRADVRLFLERFGELMDDDLMTALAEARERGTEPTTTVGLSDDQC